MRLDLLACTVQLSRRILCMQEAPVEHLKVSLAADIDVMCVMTGLVIIIQPAAWRRAPTRRPSRPSCPCQSGCRQLANSHHWLCPEAQQRWASALSRTWTALQSLCDILAC